MLFQSVLHRDKTKLQYQFITVFLYFTLSILTESHAAQQARRVGLTIFPYYTPLYGMFANGWRSKYLTDTAATVLLF